MSVRKITLLDHPDGVFLPLPEDFLAQHNLREGDVLDVTRAENGITLIPRRAKQDEQTN